MKAKTIIGTAFIACGILLLNSCASIPKNAKPVENFDINRYLGAWYEIARFDFRFEKDLDNTSAQYELDKKGNVRGAVYDGLKKKEIEKLKKDARFDIMRSILPEGMWLKPTFEKKIVYKMSILNRKRKLRIALRIAEVCDFLTEDIKFNEIVGEEYLKFTEEEFNEVMEEFEGYGISKLEEEIINEYFKENDNI